MSGPSSDSHVVAHDSSAAYVRLRLWPGVLIVGLMWLIQLGALLAPPNVRLFFFTKVIVPMVAAALVLLWWIFLSRIRWRDRTWILTALLLGVGATVLFNRQNFPGMALILYALPIVLTVWVGWLLISACASWPVRRGVLLAAFAIMAVVFTSLRVDGMKGDFAAAFSWRWTPTSEDQLLSELAAAPCTAGNAPADAAAEDAVAEQPAAEALVLQSGDWPGFRGAARDGRLSGVRIVTDWAKSPPRQLWRHRIGPGWSSVAVIGNRAFTQEQRGENEMIVCYDAQSGSEIWNHADATRFTEVVAGPGPRATPTFDAGLIYSLGASGHLNCLDAATGKLKWARDITKDADAKLPQWGFASSPLVAEGIVSVFAGGPNGKSVLGYDAATGEPAWHGGEGELSYCSTQLVQIGGISQLLINTDAGLTAFAPKTGEVLWAHSWPTEKVARVVQPALVGNGDVVIGAGLGVGTRRIHVSHETDSWPIQELWTTTQIQPYYNDFVVQGDYLYGFNNNIFMCVGLEDGKVRWKHRGYGNGQVLLLPDQDLLLVLSEEGNVALVDASAKKHNEISGIKAIEGKTWNHPVIAHDTLFVRNGDEIAAYALQSLSSDQAQNPEADTSRQ